MKKVNVLLSKVTNLIKNSEYRGVKLHGVTCSRADLEMIQFYCELLLNGQDLSNYIVCSQAKVVFDKLGIVYN
jgi:hypothetical protein